MTRLILSNAETSITFSIGAIRKINQVKFTRPFFSKRNVTLITLVISSLSIDELSMFTIIIVNLDLPLLIYRNFLYINTQVLRQFISTIHRRIPSISKQNYKYNYTIYKF